MSLAEYESFLGPREPLIIVPSISDRPAPPSRPQEKSRSPLTGVSGGIYYEGIYMEKVILTEIYMLEHFL